MDYTVPVPVDVLRRALVAVSNKVPRYYLCGVRIAVEIRPAGARLIVQATNGHFAYSYASDAAGGTGGFDVIIPTDVVKAALRLAAREQTIIEVTQDSINGISFTPIDGSFPDMRRVFPREITNEYARFNVYYLAAIARAMGMRSGQLPILHNGDSPALIQDDIGIWIIMPCRCVELEPVADTAPLLEQYF